MHAQRPLWTFVLIQLLPHSVFLARLSVGLQSHLAGRQVILRSSSAILDSEVHQLPSAVSQLSSRSPFALFVCGSSLLGRRASPGLYGRPGALVSSCYAQVRPASCSGRILPVPVPLLWVCSFAGIFADYCVRLSFAFGLSSRGMSFVLRRFRWVFFSRQSAHSGRFHHRDSPRLTLRAWLLLPAASCCRVGLAAGLI